MELASLQYHSPEITLTTVGDKTIKGFIMQKKRNYTSKTDHSFEGTIKRTSKVSYPLILLHPSPPSWETCQYHQKPAFMMILPGLASGNLKSLKPYRQPVTPGHGQLSLGLLRDQGTNHGLEEWKECRFKPHQKAKRSIQEQILGRSQVKKVEKKEENRTRDQAGSKSQEIQQRA